MNKVDLVGKKYLRTDLPEIRVGEVIKIWQAFYEKEKKVVQAFEGIVIAVKNKNSVQKSFVVRGGAGGQMIEKTYSYHSPTIEKIQILEKGKARRAKLYFIRDLSPIKLKRKLKIHYAKK